MGFNKRHWQVMTMLFTLCLLVWLFTFIIDLSRFYENLIQLGWGRGLVLCVLCSGALVSVAARMRSVSAMLQAEIGLLAAMTASSSGQFYSLFSNQIIGNILGRYRIFSFYDSSSLKLASVTLLEKLMTAGLSFGCAVLGFFYLANGAEELDMTGVYDEADRLFFMLAVLATSFVLIRRSRQPSGNKADEKTGSFKGWPLHLSGAGLFTLTGQALTVTAYSYLCLALNPELDLLPVLAATSLVIFLAALPISVSGWGVREFAAIYAYGQIGVELNDALTISLVIGVTSSLIVVIAHLLLSKLAPQPDGGVISKKNDENRRALAFDRNIISLFSSFVAIFIFYQLHIEFVFGQLNLNFADPLALLAFSAVAGLCLFKGVRPQWIIPSGNWQITAWSVALIYGFVIGFLNFGLIEWAFVSRLLGWLVLLGYLCCGILVVNFLGTAGVENFFNTLLLSVSIIVGVCFGLHIFDFWLPLHSLMPTGFSGFSANRNAFAYQLLFLCAFCLAYYGNDFGTGRRGKAFLFALICAGIIFTGSRAGLISMVCLLVAASALKFTSHQALIFTSKYLIMILGTVYAFSLFSPLLLYVFNSVFNSAEHVNLEGMLPVYSHGSSNTERWQSIVIGLQLWSEQPILGIGLGSFFHNSQAHFGNSLVIHSTPVWILVEFGLIGFICLSLLGLFTVKQIFSLGYDNARIRLALLAVVVFASFGLFHEIFYQRIFWLTAGMALAAPFFSHMPEDTTSSEKIVPEK